MESSGARLHRHAQVLFVRKPEKVCLRRAARSLGWRQPAYGPGAATGTTLTLLYGLPPVLSAWVDQTR